MDYYEELSNKEIKSGKLAEFVHKKESKAPDCPVCSMFMVPTVKPKGTKWDCGGVDCYHSFIEPFSKD